MHALNVAIYELANLIFSQSQRCSETPKGIVAYLVSCMIINLVFELK